jgi:N-sulfoglucosamine sulfohydrolase
MTKLSWILCLALPLVASASMLSAAQAPPNILIVTVDDMNCDSVGAFGCQLAETTPRIDRLAGEGLKFQYAHVVVGNCMPSRNVMWSGRYPAQQPCGRLLPGQGRRLPGARRPHEAARLFHRDSRKGLPFHALPAVCLGSQSRHGSAAKGCTSKTPIRITVRRNGASPRPGSRQAVLPDGERLRSAQAVLCNGKQRQWSSRTPQTQPRIHAGGSARFPGSCSTTPDVRKELAHYYSSVRRADDCVGKVLDALDESGPGGEHAGAVSLRPRHAFAFRQDAGLSPQHLDAFDRPLARGRESGSHRQTTHGLRGGFFADPFGSGRCGGSRRFGRPIVLARASKVKRNPAAT